MAWIVKTFGRRMSDPYIAIDWQTQRAIRKVRTVGELVTSRKLEVIDSDDREKCVAIGILRHGWADWYFMNERIGWPHESYFEYAEEMFATNNINPWAKWYVPGTN